MINSRLRKRVGLFLALIMILAVFSGCGKSETAGGSQEPGSAAGSQGSGSAAGSQEPGSAAEGGIVAGSVLNVVAPVDMPNLLPMANQNLPGFTVSYNVYNGLTVPYNGDWNDLRPALAESWEISEDGLIYVFKLRQGVKFHDGSDFNARDVIATFDYVKKNQASVFTNIQSYVATDDYTVTVTMVAPFPDFLGRLGSFAFGILSAEALEQYGETNEAAVGCGPYYVDSYSSGEVLVLKAFPDYWDKDNAPKIETVNFEIITDANTAFIALQNGEVDLVLFGTTLQYQTAESSANLDAYTLVDPSNYLLYLNSSKAQFADVRVRQALNMLIDREQVNLAAFDGLAKGATSTWAEISPIYAEMAYTYDVEAGLALLKEAGYEPGDIAFNLDATSSPAEKTAAENIQAQLLALGMQVELTIGDFGALIHSRMAGEFEAMFFDTGANVYAPCNALEMMASSIGAIYSSLFTETDPEFQADMDAKIADCMKSPSAAEANEKGAAITAEYQAAIPWIPIIQRDSYHIFNANLKGLVFENSSGFAKFNNAYWAS